MRDQEETGNVAGHRGVQLPQRIKRQLAIHERLIGVIESVHGGEGHTIGARQIMEALRTVCQRHEPDTSGLPETPDDQARIYPGWSLACQECKMIYPCPTLVDVIKTVAPEDGSETPVVPIVPSIDVIRAYAFAYSDRAKRVADRLNSGEPVTWDMLIDEASMLIDEASWNPGWGVRQGESGWWRVVGLGR